MDDLISRQALLKLMGEEPFNWTDSDKELQEVEDYRNFRNMVEQLPSVNPQEPKWIPVSERVANFPCLASDKFGQIFIPINIAIVNNHCYEGKNFNFDVEQFLKGEEIMLDGEKAYLPPREIIAWMPLPKPYEPQKVR